MSDCNACFDGSPCNVVDVRLEVATPDGERNLGGMRPHPKRTNLSGLLFFIPMPS